MQFLLLGTVVLKSGTVELRYDGPLHNEVLGITNDFLYPSNSKMYEKVDCLQSAFSLKIRLVVI